MVNNRHTDDVTPNEKDLQTLTNLGKALLPNVIYSMFMEHIITLFAVQFAIFAVPFALRHWQHVMIWALITIPMAYGVAPLLGYSVPTAISATLVAGCSLRLITLILRRQTRNRLAKMGKLDNAKVAGRKLVIIGLSNGFPVWLLLSHHFMAG